MVPIKVQVYQTIGGFREKVRPSLFSFNLLSIDNPSENYSLARLSESKSLALRSGPSVSCYEQGYFVVSPDLHILELPAQHRLQAVECVGHVMENALVVI
jgi:hypothetical protein